VKFRFKGSIRNKLASVGFMTLSFIIVAMIYQNVSQTRQVTMVPVLTKSVTYGQAITADNVEMKEIGIFNMNKDLIRKKDDVIGHFASSALNADRYLYKEDMLSVKPATTLKEMVSKGGLAVTTDLVKCVGGLPSPGDYVKVDVIHKSTGDGSVYVDQPPVLSRVKILAIKNPSGDYIENAENKKDGSFGMSQDSKPGLVIFDATPEQESQLLAGQYSGELHMVLLPYDQQDHTSQKPIVPAAATAPASGNTTKAPGTAPAPAATSSTKQ